MSYIVEGYFTWVIRDNWWSLQCKGRYASLRLDGNEMFFLAEGDRFPRKEFSTLEQALEYVETKLRETTQSEAHFRQRAAVKAVEAVDFGELEKQVFAAQGGEPEPGVHRWPLGYLPQRTLDM